VRRNVDKTKKNKKLKNTLSKKNKVTTPSRVPVANDFEYIRAACLNGKGTGTSFLFLYFDS
jgi:hypothetical protein